MSAPRPLLRLSRACVAPGAATLSRASPAPSPLDPAREAAIDKPQVTERRTSAVAPASPEKAVIRETPGQRIAKVEPVAPLLPDASIVSAAGFSFKVSRTLSTACGAPNGEFTMGANERPHERPAHKVRIPSPFAIGQYESDLRTMGPLRPCWRLPLPAGFKWATTRSDRQFKLGRHECLLEVDIGENRAGLSPAK